VVAAPAYANLTGRPTGRLLRVLGRVIPGIAAVERQVLPYARYWQESNAAAIARGTRRWVVLGDSMSQGIGASAPSHGWVGQVLETLRDAGAEIDVVNLSASGARVDDVLRQQLPAWRALPPSPAGSDVITVLVGSNDLFSRRHRGGLPGRFDALVGELPPGSIVALLTQPSAAGRAVNERLEAARDLRLVDLRANGPASWRGKLAADHFHPNDAGYATIAAGFVAPLQEALGS
jgi:lysophospholipase L1-like esterase